MSKGTTQQAVALRGVPVLLALLSSSWVWAQVPVASVVPSGPTRVEESDPHVVYTGVWYSASRSDLSGGSIVESPFPVSAASLTFTGAGVRWIGFKAVWGGIAQVYLDGALQATVDTYAPTDQVQAVMYTATGLAAGLHTITIKVTGSASGESSASVAGVPSRNEEQHRDSRRAHHDPMMKSKAKRWHLRR